MKKNFLIPPVEVDQIVLHSCCAPCSSAMVDALLAHGIRPLIYYYNPNIFPEEEYEIRKSENKRYADSLGIDFVDGDYNHEQWRKDTYAWRDAPERGERCTNCFRLRLSATAKFTHEQGLQVFATTLATSRWKNLDQINLAGGEAAALFPDLIFWANNWRKGGLTERQKEIVEEQDFYRQQYCGCEYSLRDSNKWRKEQGRTLVRPGLSYGKGE